MFCYAVSVEVSQKDFLFSDRIVDRAKMGRLKAGARRIWRTGKRLQAVLEKDPCFRNNIRVYPRARVIAVITKDIR